MKGRVKWWNNEKGYGFIEIEDEENIFVYKAKEETNEIKENQYIEFNIIEEHGKNTLHFLKNIKAT